MCKAVAWQPHPQMARHYKERIRFLGVLNVNDELDWPYGDAGMLESKP